MLIATSYPFLEVFWTMLIFFAFVIWIWILITVLIDIFRRHDTSGFAKVLWIIVHHRAAVFRRVRVPDRRAQGHDRAGDQAASSRAQPQMDEYVKSVAAKTDPAEQIAKAKQLLDAGTIPRPSRSDRAAGAGRELPQPTRDRRRGSGEARPPLAYGSTQAPPWPLGARQGRLQTREPRSIGGRPTQRA